MAAKRKNKSTFTSAKFILALLIICISLVSIYLLAINQSGKSLSVKNDCKMGFLPEESYLKTYTVKEGDSLLSISEKELGSTGRVNELIQLNKEKHPYLSIYNDFLEVGYVLYLPSPEISNSSGKLFALEGKIDSISGNKWAIKSSDTTTFYVYTSDLTEFMNSDQKAYQAGGCVLIHGDFDGNKAYTISPQ